MGTKTFEWATPGSTNVGTIACDMWLQSLEPAERLGTVKELFLEAARQHDDKAAVAILGLLKKAFENFFFSEQVEGEEWTRKERARKFAERCFISYLAAQFFTLPKSRATGSTVWDGRKEVPEYVETLVELKCQIGRSIGFEWQPKVHEGASLSAFNFFVRLAGDYSRKTGLPELPWECPDDYHEMSREVGEAIWSALTARTSSKVYGSDGGHWDWDFWIRQPRLPEKVLLELAKARAISQEGTSVLATVEREELLAQIYKGKEGARDVSDGAMDTLRIYVQELALADHLISALVNMMTSGHWDWHKIGKSEFVPAKFTWVLARNLEHVDLIGILDKSEKWAEVPGLLDDVQGRIRRAINQWWQNQGHVHWATVSLMDGPLTATEKLEFRRPR
ncbi:MAG: hypothetical protein A2672_00505 [Candidatus Wildermuthbacteria bacterium RIFCSPHIGHO2_01_FULL_49_22b]|uniref:Uncharacterized protein n=1 Tax=Candidatus Wildermuthbacteria bacterium RIFCSPHIGHO2_01_FULL_49_22b TaxID=1802448 RepID=A0A1G2R0A0_9BACT|nr:MAG: hypothetical protein A2672_00505 [Candidatus Wildermuthbacteria bacterium RIFCSPHIGHO2_01_FULL_49_22b]